MTVALRVQIALIACFMLALISFFWTTIEWNENKQLFMLANSVPVPATIKSVSVSSSLTEVDNGGGRTSTVYEPEVTYSYTFKGHEYEGSQWRLTQVKTGIRAWAENDAKQFQPGQQTKAWVDPLHPSDAVLLHTVDFTLYGISIFLSIPMLLASEFLLLGIVPVRDGAKATATQETIFDLPCVFWFVIVGQKLYQYFSNSCAPHSIWAYIFAPVWILFSAFLVKGRMRCRVMPPHSSSVRPAGNWSVRQVGAVRPIGEGIYESKGNSRAVVERNNAYDPAALKPRSGLISLIPFALFAGIGAYQFYSVATFGDRTNPELRTVSSKEKAVQAIPEHIQNVAREPDNPWAYKNRGVNYFDAGEYHKTIDDLTVTLAKIKTPDWQTLYYRARAYMLTEQWQKALADYQAMLKCEQKPFDVYCSGRGMGICNYHLKKYKQAAQDFTMSLESKGTSDNANPELLHDRALCYQHLGRPHLAEKDFKAVPFWRSSQYWLQ